MRTMTALGPIFALGLGAGVSGTVAAQEAIDERRAFDLIDANDDGVIDVEEVRTGSDAWFLAYDADADGVLTRDEIVGRDDGTSARLVLADLDQDGDGSVSREEFLDAQRLHYDERAAGGELTSRDYAEMRSERDDPLVPDLDEDGVVSEQEAAAEWQRSFFSMDLDGDGQISEEEWIGDVEGGPAFADLDADQDEVVSRREYLAYGKQAYYDTRERSDGGQVTADAYLDTTSWRDQALWPNPDLDGDGVISAEEFTADAEQWFGSFDYDRDGIITGAEYDPERIAIRDITDTFAASGDADVIISRDDFVAFREQRLEEADLDDDGVVTVWEYRAYRGD